MAGRRRVGRHTWVSRPVLVKLQHAHKLPGEYCKNADFVSVKGPRFYISNKLPSDAESADHRNTL